MHKRVAQLVKAVVLAAPFFLPVAVHAQNRTQDTWRPQLEGTSTTEGTGADIEGRTSLGPYVQASTAPGQAATERMSTSVASLSTYDADLPPPAAKAAPAPSAPIGKIPR